MTPTAAGLHDRPEAATEHDTPTIQGNGAARFSGIPARRDLTRLLDQLDAQSCIVSAPSLRCPLAPVPPRSGEDLEDLPATWKYNLSAPRSIGLRRLRGRSSTEQQSDRAPTQQSSSTAK